MPKPTTAPPRVGTRAGNIRAMRIATLQQTAEEMAGLLDRLVRAADAFDPEKDGIEALLTFLAEAQSRIPREARTLLARIDSREGNQS
jgi:hypothetical protein